MSRAVSLGVRLSFVFPVTTWFPVVVSRYYNHVQLRSAPPRTGRAPLTHPAPHGDYPPATGLRSAPALSYHLDSGSVSRRCSLAYAITAWPPSLDRHYPASTVLCSLPTSRHRLIVSRIRIEVSYSMVDGSTIKNDGISLVALTTLCVTRMDLRLRASG